MNSAGSLELLKMVPQSVSVTALEIEPIWISLGLVAKLAKLGDKNGRKWESPERRVCAG